MCGDGETLELIAKDPTGDGLAPEDRAVYQFAAKVATAADSVSQQDVDHLRRFGLADADVADIVFAAAARSFFTRVLDGLGTQLDTQTARTFSADLLTSMVVGRPPAEG